MYRYPYMDRKHINQTIQNAKRLAMDFNKEQEEKSSSIKVINRELRKAAKDHPHTAAQKVAFQEFKSEHQLKEASPQHYNHAVLRFNRENGTNFLMREFTTLRNEIAITLPFLVVFYAAQIRDRNAKRMNAGVTTVGTLPRLLTNSQSLSQYQVDGVEQCPYHKGTILKHVHALVEAGVLVNYKSHGRNVGFSVEFNPEILAVGDMKTGKIQLTLNQLSKEFKNGKPYDNDYTTRTVLNKNENKGDVTTPPEDRLSTSVDATCSNKTTGKNTYRATGTTTRSEQIQGQDQGTPRGKSAEDSRSEALSSKIRDRWELCRELSDNVHVDHVPDVALLEWESQKGTMSQSEFRMLLFQEFLKYVSRLKRGDQSAAGAFYRAMEELDDKKMVNFVGRYFTKPKMMEEFRKWLWMVDHAERWGKKREWQFLYVNDYLDTQRRDAREVGFWYLEKQWNANELKKQQRKKRRAKKVVEHLERKKKIKTQRVADYGYRSVKPNLRSKTDFEKAQAKVRQYLYGKIGFDDLYRYLEANTNHAIVSGLKNLIDSEREKLRKYNA